MSKTIFEEMGEIEDKAMSDVKNNHLNNIITKETEEKTVEQLDEIDFEEMHADDYPVAKVDFEKFVQSIDAMNRDNYLKHEEQLKVNIELRERIARLERDGPMEET